MSDLPTIRPSGFGDSSLMWFPWIDSTALQPIPGLRNREARCTCFAVSEEGDYRIVRSLDDGHTQRVHGNNLGVSPQKKTLRLRALPQSLKGGDTPPWRDEADAEDPTSALIRF
jgi:hypothetical protein